MHSKYMWITLFKNINFFGIMKKGYIIVRVSIFDSNLFQQYPPLSAEVMNKYGGKYIIRGGKTDVLEGAAKELATEKANLIPEKDPGPRPTK